MHGPEITGEALNKTGRFAVFLSSVGNPDHGQDPDQSLPGVPNDWKRVKTLKEAAIACREYIDENDLGGGNWMGGKVACLATKSIVAKISYNGRVWTPEEKQSEPQPHAIPSIPRG